MFPRQYCHIRIIRHVAPPDGDAHCDLFVYPITGPDQIFRSTSTHLKALYTFQLDIPGALAFIRGEAVIARRTANHRLLYWYATGEISRGRGYILPLLKQQWLLQHPSPDNKLALRGTRLNIPV